MGFLKFLSSFNFKFSFLIFLLIYAIFKWLESIREFDLNVLRILESEVKSSNLPLKNICSSRKYFAYSGPNAINNRVNESSNPNATPNYLTGVWPLVSGNVCAILIYYTILLIPR